MPVQKGPRSQIRDFNRSIQKWERKKQIAKYVLSLDQNSKTNPTDLSDEQHISDNEAPEEETLPPAGATPEILAQYTKSSSLELIQKADAKIKEYQEKIAKLKSFVGDLDNHKSIVQSEIQIVSKYKKLKFIEKKKLERKIYNTTQALKKAKELGQKTTKLEKRLARQTSFLDYIQYYPRDTPYLSLFPTARQLSDETKAQQLEILHKIQSQMKKGDLTVFQPKSWSKPINPTRMKRMRSGELIFKAELNEKNNSQNPPRDIVKDDRDRDSSDSSGSGSGSSSSSDSDSDSDSGSDSGSSHSDSPQSSHSHSETKIQPNQKKNPIKPPLPIQHKIMTTVAQQQTPKSQISIQLEKSRSEHQSNLSTDPFFSMASASDSDEDLTLVDRTPQNDSIHLAPARKRVRYVDISSKSLDDTGRRKSSYFDQNSFIHSKRNENLKRNKRRPNTARR